VNEHVYAIREHWEEESKSQEKLSRESNYEINITCSKPEMTFVLTEVQAHPMRTEPIRGTAIKLGQYVTNR